MQSGRDLRGPLRELRLPHAEERKEMSKPETLHDILADLRSDKRRFSNSIGMAIADRIERALGFREMKQDLKDAILKAVDVVLERDDMTTPCTFDPENGKEFMTSSEHYVCDGDGYPISDETIASALNAVARIQVEYRKAADAK